MNTNRKQHSIPFLNCWGSLVIVAAWSAQAIADETLVQITLSPKVVVNRSDVVLGDIAHVRGGTFNERRRIENLDLHSLSSDEKCTLSAEFIRLRLMLANLSERRLEFKGPSQVLVQLDENPKSIESIVHQDIEQAVADRVEYPISSVQVRILQPIQKYWGFDTRQLALFTPEISLPEGAILGRRSIVVHLHDRDQLVATRSVPCEIAILQTELRLAKSISRGELVTSENTVLKERFQTSSAGNLDLESALGRRIRRSMEVGDRLTTHDLLPLNQNTNSEIVIKSRSAIRLIAHMGQIEIIVPMAEALQSGRVGQIIRVKNLQSNRIINARVVNAEEAVVDLGIRN